MKRKLVLILLILVLIYTNTSCSMNLLTDSANKNLQVVSSKNIITQTPPYGTVTYELDNRLVGKYQAENDPKMYFEIKPDGKAEISLSNLEGYQEFSSQSLLVTAYYYDPEIKRVLLTFHLINGEMHFPLNSAMSINFESERNELYQVFNPLIEDNENKVKFIKVK